MECSTNALCLCNMTHVSVGILSLVLCGQHTQKKTWIFFVSLYLTNCFQFFSVWLSLVRDKYTNNSKSERRDDNFDGNSSVTLVAFFSLLNCRQISKRSEKPALCSNDTHLKFNLEIKNHSINAILR